MIIVEPTKSDTHAVADLLDVILRDGAVVQADVVITVADVPLVGISLRAAIAGMTAMAEYGVFAEWDRLDRLEETRETRTPLAEETTLHHPEDRS